jgi:hypothetical protein
MKLIIHKVPVRWIYGVEDGSIVVSAESGARKRTHFASKSFMKESRKTSSTQARLILQTLQFQMASNPVETTAIRVKRGVVSLP